MHHYTLTLYALNAPLELADNAQRADVMTAMAGKVLARGIVVAIAAVLGGRLYHVIDQWALYRGELLQNLKRWTVEQYSAVIRTLTPADLQATVRRLQLPEAPRGRVAAQPRRRGSGAGGGCRRGLEIGGGYESASGGGGSDAEEFQRFGTHEGVSRPPSTHGDPGPLHA